VVLCIVVNKLFIQVKVNKLVGAYDVDVFGAVGCNVDSMFSFALYASVMLDAL
jgi:hypothetical protein